MKNTLDPGLSTISKTAIILISTVLLLGMGAADTLTVNPDDTGDYSSIQGAVDAAGQNDKADIIKVEPGTYEESVNIDTADITLESTEGAEATKISANANEGVMINESNVTVRGFTVTTTPDNTKKHGQYGIRLEPSGAVEDILIEENIVENISDMYRPSGISLDMKYTSDKTATNITVRDNIVRNITGVQSDDYSAVAKAINPNERFVDLVIDNNTIRKIGNNHSVGASAIDMSSDTGVTPNVGPKDFKITDNDIDGITTGENAPNTVWKDKIALYLHDYGNLGDHTVTDNQFRDGRVIYNTESVNDPDTLEATGNYWGQPSGPEESRISGEIEWHPYYTDSDMETLKVNESSSIQEALDTANPNDTIQVSQGTYVENLAIGKSVSIEGAGKEKTTVTFTGEGTSDGTATVSIESSDVTLSQMTVERNQNADRNVNGGHVQGISVEGSNTVIEKVNVRTDREEGYERFDGIVVFDGSGNNVSNVQVSQVDVSGFYTGFVATQANENSVSDVRLTESAISGNTYGVTVKSHSEPVPSNIRLSENKIRSNTETGLVYAPDNYQGYNLHGDFGSEEMDATHNFWGQPTGPEETQISGEVDRRPYYPTEQAFENSKSYDSYHSFLGSFDTFEANTERTDDEIIETVNNDETIEGLIQGIAEEEDTTLTEDEVVGFAEQVDTTRSDSEIESIAEGVDDTRSNGAIRSIAEDVAANVSTMSEDQVQSIVESEMENVVTEDELSDREETIEEQQETIESQEERIDELESEVAEINSRMNETLEAVENDNQPGNSGNSNGVTGAFSGSNPEDNEGRSRGLGNIFSGIFG
jgi:hypothetical protein